jgi:hypothetical protein
MVGEFSSWEPGITVIDEIVLHRLKIGFVASLQARPGPGRKPRQKKPRIPPQKINLKIFEIAFLQLEQSPYRM